MASKLVSDVVGCADDGVAVTEASGNCGVTAMGTGNVNSDKGSIELLVVSIGGKASWTDWEAAACGWTSLLVRTVFASDYSSSD